MVGFIELTILTKLSIILYLMYNTDSDINTNNLIVKGENIPAHSLIHVLHK